MFSLRGELSTCLKWCTSLTSLILNIGPWILNCWMSSSTESVPCRRLESFCCAVASRFGSTNMRSTLALNSSIVTGVPEGLRICWILCIAHVLVAPPFMYDRMNSIWLVSLANSDPCRHMYRLHSTLKQSRLSWRPVNGVGAVIFGSLVMVGGGGGSTGSDIVWALSWFCSAWIWSVSWATWSSSDDMVMGNRNGESEEVGFEVFFCCQSMS